MVDGTLHSVWENVLADKLDQPPLIEAISLGEGMTNVVFGAGQRSLNLHFTEIELGKEAAELGKETADTCILAAKNLITEYKEEMIKLASSVSTMRKTINKLKEVLNPLILGPIILRTRCDLCPA